MKEQTSNVEMVIDDVENVTVQANEVTAAAKVQANDVKQLVKNISEIKRVINLNARDAESTSELAKELYGYSEEIIGAMQELAK